MISAKRIDLASKTRRRIRSKPSRGTEFVLLRNRDKFVMNSVIMNVIQASQITLLEGQASIPVLKPHFTTKSVIEFVDLGGRCAMQVTG